MSYLAMNQLQGLGYADIVAAVVQPLAQGGADIYRTYSESEQSQDELKQRRRELAAMQVLYSDQLRYQERQQALGAALAMRKAQISGAYQTSYAPYLLGAAAVGGAGVRRGGVVHESRVPIKVQGHGLGRVPVAVEVGRIGRDGGVIAGVDTR